MSGRNWTTRPETDADVAAVRRINLAAFPTAEEADLVDALRADPAWIPGLSLIAVAADGEPVGHALLTRCRVGEEGPALALAPVAVLPEHQGRGAGSAAIEAALAVARARQENLVVVLGHPAYYPRFGFRRASQQGIRASFDVPDEALMSLALHPDRPTPTGTIHYPVPFGV
ncbi:GNAT family N-acetyltransferase [Streptomyces sp. NBRC 109706]|uniref:GNAT family N-acetyltransferase n=1 Tax=Streptomyces sp. NBRC 109706 TaxID=1550035 RepID=UPI000A5F17E2|nr:N-acetyltransferase [Streptomyces sp. NBRC 109706]